MQVKIVGQTVHTSRDKVWYWHDTNIEDILNAQAITYSGPDEQKSVLYAKQFLNFYVGLTLEQYPVSHVFLTALSCINLNGQSILSVIKPLNRSFEAQMLINPQDLDLYTELNFNIYCPQSLILNERLTNGCSINVKESQKQNVTQFSIENFYKFYWILLESDRKADRSAACNYLGYLSLVLVRTVLQSNASISRYILSESVRDIRKFCDSNLNFKTAPPHSNTFKEIRKFLVVGTTTTTTYLAHLLYVYINSTRQVKEILETGCLNDLKYYGMDLLQLAMKLADESKIDLRTVIRSADFLPLASQIEKLKKVFFDSFEKEQSQGFAYSMLLNPFYHCDLNRLENENLMILFRSAIGMLKSNSIVFGKLKHFQEVWLAWFLSLVTEPGDQVKTISADYRLVAKLNQARLTPNYKQKIEWLSEVFRGNRYLLTSEELRALLNQMDYSLTKQVKNNYGSTFPPLTSMKVSSDFLDAASVSGASTSCVSPSYTIPNPSTDDELLRMIQNNVSLTSDAAQIPGVMNTETVNLSPGNGTQPKCFDLDGNLVFKNKQASRVSFRVNKGQTSRFSATRPVKIFNPVTLEEAIVDRKDIKTKHSKRGKGKENEAK